MSDHLGPLPEPDFLNDRAYWSHVYSAANMRAYAAAEVAKERERCARIVESQDTYGDPVGCWLETLAAKIRSQHD